jgi:hypothetical protein
MIVHPAKHLFQAKFPSLEDHEEEIFYQHPLYDIKVNQLGVLYCDNDVYGIYDKGDTSMVRHQATRKSLGSKTRIIWECYTGEIINSPHFFYVNGNPMDTRFENMILSGPLSAKQRQPYLNVKARFTQASVEHLVKLEEKMEAVGVDKDQLYAMLLLPQWLRGARRRWVPGRNLNPKAKDRPKSLLPSNADKTRTTPEEIEEVIRLFNQGQTFYAIIQRMGWNSTSRIKKIAKDYGLVR